MLIIQLIQYYIKLFSRKCYWFYRLWRSDLGSKISIDFPLKIEGQGALKIGDNCSFNKNVYIGVSSNAFLNLGDNCNFGQSATVIVGSGCNVNIKPNFKLGESTRLYLNSSSKIEENVSIATSCSIFAREKDDKGFIKIGRNSSIGDHTLIDLVDNVQIGSDVAIGPNCTIYTHDHEYKDKSLPAWKGGIVSKPVIIEDGAWVGSNVIILPGIIIGKRAVVAAGSVVTKNVESETICAGIPARVIKHI